MAVISPLQLSSQMTATRKTDPFNPFPVKQTTPSITAPKPASNFQTLNGQNTYVPPPSTGALQALGQKAKAPEQNIPVSQPKLAPAQVSTYIPPAKQVAPPPAPPQAPTQPSGGLYGQLIGQLSQTAKPSDTQTGLIADLRKTATANPLESGGAYDVYGKQVQNLNALKQGIAKQYAGIESQPIPLEFQQGREQILARQNASLLDAQQQAVSQAQQALGYGVQEQQAQQSGLNSALGGANTQQAQQLSGLGTAAGLAAPQLSSFGQGFYNPLDPNGGAAGAGGGALNPINNIPSLAQAVLSGQISPQQAFQMGGNVPNFQGALTQALLQVNPNANIAQLQGAFDARQANTTTAGTTPTETAAAGYQQSVQNYNQMNTIYNAADSQAGIGQMFICPFQI